jgi:CHAD domain-containing protein
VTAAPVKLAVRNIAAGGGVSSIRKDLPAGEALRRHMRKALRALSDDLAAALEGSGVHAARKRLKLSRSLLSMMRPAIGEAVFDQEDACLKGASQALAGFRRHEAMMETVHKLASASGAEGEEAVRALAEAVAHLQMTSTHSTSLAERVAAAHAEVEGLRERLADWPLPKRDIRLFVTGMQASYERARKKLRQGIAEREVTLLHEARKSIIHHYHHLDLLKPLWPKLFAVWLAELQDLREALGDLNDLDELDELLDTGDIALPDEALSEAARGLIGARRERLIATIANEAGHLFAESPKSFAARMAALWEQWLA